MGIHNQNFRPATVSVANLKSRHDSDGPQYVRVPVLNDDLHRVGFELIRIGPGLAASIRRLATEGRL
jgi:hypothetical protein